MTILIIEMLSEDEVYLCYYCVEQQEAEECEEDIKALKAQHGVGDEVVDSWQCDSQWQLSHHFGKIVGR